MTLYDRVRREEETYLIKSFTAFVISLLLLLLLLLL